eukprot:2634659-Karenia_brevis.AAC.1
MRVALPNLVTHESGQKNGYKECEIKSNSEKKEIEEPKEEPYEKETPINPWRPPQIEYDENDERQTLRPPSKSSKGCPSRMRKAGHP